MESYGKQGKGRKTGMGKIMLFGSTDVYTVPHEVKKAIEDFAKAGWEFIIGSRNGAEAALHKELSALGARENTTILGLDEIYNNKWDLNEYIYKSVYDEESKTCYIVDENEEPIHQFKVPNIISIPSSPDYFTFLSKVMMDACDFAICIWNGESKAELNNIRTLGIKNKPCYRFIV